MSCEVIEYCAVIGCPLELLRFVSIIGLGLVIVYVSLCTIAASLILNACAGAEES